MTCRSSDLPKPTSIGRARNKPRRQIRDDAVYVRKRQMLATDAAAANPIDYTPIVQREVNPKLKIPLRFELMTRDFRGLFATISCAGSHWPALEPEANAQTRSSTPNRSGRGIPRWG